MNISDLLHHNQGIFRIDHFDVHISYKDDIAYLIFDTFLTKQITVRIPYQYKINKFNKLTVWNELEDFINFIRRSYIEEARKGILIWYRLGEKQITDHRTIPLWGTGRRIWKLFDERRRSRLVPYVLYSGSRGEVISRFSKSESWEIKSTPWTELLNIFSHLERMAEKEIS